MLVLPNSFGSLHRFCAGKPKLLCELTVETSILLSDNSTPVMSASEQVDVIIYRVRESGLEVFLVNQDLSNPEQLSAPTADESSPERLANSYIELDPVADSNGEFRKAIAIEADWHEIPSLRALMYEDYRVAKEKAKQHIKSFLPDIEKGTYVAVKEAFKRVMPQQYAFLKELKDILSDKNQTKYI